MTEQHPITPPVDLIRKWNEEAATAPMADQRYIATQAARWGADQELEACVNYVDNFMSGNKARALRAARRPKSLSLKQQALEALSRLNSGSLCANPVTDKATIRRALEQLND